MTQGGGGRGGRQQSQLASLEQRLWGRGGRGVGRPRAAHFRSWPLQRSVQSHSRRGGICLVIVSFVFFVRYSIRETTAFAN